MFQVGPYRIDSRVVLAPMAGVTDRPFRQLCRRMGAGLVVSEMVTCDTQLWHTRKSQLRLDHTGENEPRSVQIVGGDPDMMAKAAATNIERGAQIVDINMGCPAKKVCKRAAGSALLRDEQLVSDILNAVVCAAGDVPVTLKIRTGWSPEQRNGITIAKIAEQAGIQALAVHGRTRACRFQGEAEYDTIAAIVDSVTIPVLANGDIDSPKKASEVLTKTGAKGVMIGRAAQGRPWIFREIQHYLDSDGATLPGPANREVGDILCSHLQALHQFYGDYMGVRIARKHIGWYLQTLNQIHSFTEGFRQAFNKIDNTEEQQARVQQLIEHLVSQEDKAA